MNASQTIGVAAPMEINKRSARSPARLWLVFCCIFAAGMDVRFSHVAGKGPSSNLLELLMVVMFLFLLADTIINRYHISEMAAAAWRTNRYIVCYSIWIFFAAWIGVAYYPLSLFVLRNIFPAVVFFCFISYAIRKTDDLSSLMLAFVISAIPNVFLGLCQLVFGKPYIIPLNLASSVKMDVDGSIVKVAVSGLFNHPNALSVYLLPAFLTGLGLAFSKARMAIWLRFGLFLFVGASATLLYATKAKGSWLWVAFGVFVLLWPRSILKSRYGAALLGTSVVGVIAGAVVISIIKGGALSTMMTRILLWKSAMFAMVSEPFIAVFGSGQAAVWYASAKLADLQYDNAHNVFLNQAVYFGIPAAVLYVGCFAYAVREAHRSYSSSEDVTVRTCAHICIAVLCAMAGQYFFEPAAESSGLAVEAFLFMAMAGALKWRRQ
jgi:hypothetical protein